MVTAVNRGTEVKDQVKELDERKSQRDITLVGHSYGNRDSILPGNLTEE